ncbi:fibronectin type III domain-containing protein [Anaeromyxobacter oryzisoli]|uniref:fibronectin type III domain-containing protein n=1 Tax=Anaeromyxobacter oryzisoli TaxID=2925408 RepID=UPI001F57E029|nr:fibronectin type III domain-containing protein [Anaeromyxobacter sp. SG63]
MRAIGVMVASLAMVLPTACGRQAPAGGSADPNGFAAADGPARQPLTATDSACGGTGAHDKHATTGIGCASCHPCGGSYGFADAPTLPGGTSAVGGAVVRSSGTTSCTVACHYPFGASPQAVSWSTPGPLACSACHSNVASASQTYRSAHTVAQTDPTTNRAACQSCHETSLHTSGHVRIDVGSGQVVDASVSDPVQLNATCQGCHGGSGRTISGETPPVLPGWSSPTGDFHGARGGAGFGGTLASPYTVGQGPLACTECHDAHASQNAFLFASTAGGVPVVPATIDRAGVGAEMLCANCHLGNRHAGCMISNCHTSDPAPAGKPCFFCHGHEGIVNFTLPTWDNHPNGNGSYCSHCHSPGWFPVVEYTPPRFVSGPTLSASATAATVTWTTDEPATSWVELGTASDALGTTVGDGALTTTHQVALTGLSQLTSYAIRVRTSDAFRNVAFSPITSFTTSSASAPPAPALTPEPDFAYEWGGTPPPASYTATFQWSAVAAPDGHPVQYRFQLATTSTFDAPLVDVWLDGTTYQRALAVTQYPGVTYSWRVQARDAVETASVGPWTPAGRFAVYWYMPY